MASVRVTLDKATEERLRVVSLTLHKNTQNKRRLHRVSTSLIQSAHTIARQKGCAGFAIVAWNDAGTVTAAFDLSSDVIPTSVVPQFVAETLRSHIAQGR